MRAIRRALLLAFMSTALSCSSDAIENPWLQGRPSDVSTQRWQELPSQRFREVSNETRAEAVRLLEKEVSQRLPGRDVQRFVPGDVFGQPVGRFYLLRAVSSRGGNCSSRVLTSGRAVTVRYDCQSGSRDTMQTAVVADLQQAPETVYVELHVAE